MAIVEIVEGEPERNSYGNAENQAHEENTVRPAMVKSVGTGSE
jgi:hypothetical protein